MESTEQKQLTLIGELKIMQCGRQLMAEITEKTHNGNGSEEEKKLTINTYT